MPATAADERKESHHPMGTARPTLDAYQLHTSGPRPLRRLGAGLLTGSAA